MSVWCTVGVVISKVKPCPPSALLVGVGCLVFLGGTSRTVGLHRMRYSPLLQLNTRHPVRQCTMRLGSRTIASFFFECWCVYFHQWFLFLFVSPRVFLRAPRII